MKKILRFSFIAISITILSVPFGFIKAQTVIKYGAVKGIWTKKSSPYLIRGDINVPAGQTLRISAGVVVKFEGLYTINVQGSLIAEGTEADSIIFTAADTSGIVDQSRYGWNGIRFDRRPVEWVTERFVWPEDKVLANQINELIVAGEIDTIAKTQMVLKVPDEVNDKSLPDNLFLSASRSRLQYCRFEFATSASKNQPYIFGGAIYIYRYSNLIIQNCVFENNSAFAGGAIYCKESGPIIVRNRFTECTAQSSGGAMAFVYSGPVLLNNSILFCKSGFNGGGMFFYESSPYVFGNTLFKNRAENWGGGIFCEKSYSTYLAIRTYEPAEKIKFNRDGTFENTNIDKTYTRSISNDNGRFQNNVICKNHASFGGGVGLRATNPEITSATIADNLADSAGGGVLCYFAAPTLTNSIVYNNSQGQLFLSADSKPIFNFCDLQGGSSGIRKDTACKYVIDMQGILDIKADFNNPAKGDYSLLDGSGCIDAGIPDTTALKLPIVDLFGNRRIINGRIDLGAIESNGLNAILKNTVDPLILSESKDTLDPEDNLFTSIFPNPAIEYFSIVIHNNKYERIHVKMISQSGQKVYDQIFQGSAYFEQTIDLASMPKGINLVILSSDDTIFYRGQVIIE